MGTQKRKWRENYSQRDPRQRHANRLARSMALKRIRRPTRIVTATSSRILAERIHTIVSEDLLDLEECNKVSMALLSRLNISRPHIPLGKIKDLKIPVRYVKPAHHYSDVDIGTNFDILLSPYHFTNYIVVLERKGTSLAVMITRKKDILEGAVNFLSIRHQRLGYLSYLYDYQKIESLFEIECIRPFEPSPNYKEV